MSDISVGGIDSWVIQRSHFRARRVSLDRPQIQTRHIQIVQSRVTGLDIITVGAGRNVDIFIAIPTRNELTGGDEFLYPNIDNIAAEADVF